MITVYTHVLSRQARTVLALSTAVVYALAFVPLDRALGHGVAALSSVPVVVVGWFLGTPAGLLAGLLAIPVNTILLNLAGETGWDAVIQAGGAPALPVLVLLGAVFGRLHDLNERLKRELTERRCQEAQVDTVRAYLQTLHDSSPDCIIATDAKGRITAFNPGAEELLGYRAEEVLGQRVEQLYPSLEAARAVMRAMRADPRGRVRNLEVTLRHKDGREIPVLLSAAILRDAEGQEQGTVGYSKDLTGRKRTEQALTESYRELQLLAEINQAYLNGEPFDQIIKRVAQALTELSHAQMLALYLYDKDQHRLVPQDLGFSRPIIHKIERLVGDDLTNYAPLLRDGHRFAEALTTGRSFIASDPKEIAALYGEFTDNEGLKKLIKPVMKLLNVKNVAVIPLLSNGDPLGLITWNSRTSLSEKDLERIDRFGKLIASTLVQVKAEEALAQERNLLRTLMDNLPDYIFVKDTESRFITTNAAHLQILGAETLEEVIGKTDFAFFPQELAELYYADEQAVIRSGEPLLNRVEVAKDQEGRTQWLLTTKVPLRDSSGSVIGLVGVSRDITDRRQRERELEAVVNMSAALRSAPTRAEMLPIILDQLMDLLDANGAALALRDPVSGETVIELARGEIAGTTGERLPAGAGASGNVIETGQPYLNNDVRSGPCFLNPDQLGHIRAVAGVPLIAQEHTIGALWVGRNNANITDHELRLLAAVGDIAANAIHRATLHEQTERSLRRLTVLRNMDMAINASLDLRVTLNILLDQVTTRLGVDAASVLLLNPHTQRLEYRAGSGFRSTAITRIHARPGDEVRGRAALERRIVSIPNLPESEAFSVVAPALAGEGFTTYYGVPLIAKGQVKGVLEVFHRAPLDPSTGSGQAPDPEWLDFLNALATQAAIAIDNAELFDNLQRSQVDLTLAYDTTLEGWARALELRDYETKGHSQRVTDMTLRLAQAMGVSDAELVHIRRGALLHDIGKMAIPDSILLKPGPLDDDEWHIMRQHPVYAYQLLSPIAFLRPALDIPHYHHEKWDGTGYPQGLKGEQIPLAARIFAVVDVYDALRSDRPYRDAWSEEKVREYIQAQAGRHFDPQVVEVFMEMEETFIGNGIASSRLSPA